MDLQKAMSKRVVELGVDLRLSVRVKNVDSEKAVTELIGTRDSIFECYARVSMVPILY